MYLHVAVKLQCKTSLYLVLKFRIKNTENQILSSVATKTHYLEEFYYLLKRLLSHMLNYKYLHYFLLL